MNDPSTTGTAVSHVVEGALTVPLELVEAARDYARAAHAPRTRDAYARAWTVFEAWCGEKTLPSLPASPEAVAIWMAALAKGEGPRKPLSRSTINQALSAVVMKHRDGGYPFDRKHRAIATVWKGISNSKARTEAARQARPLLAGDLQALLRSLHAKVPGDARDAALLALGWAGALRRSELVGLDWQKLGTGTGFLSVDERGLVVTLMVSKASQDRAETIVVPRADMPAACEAVDTWARVADLKPGQSVFRPINQRHTIGGETGIERLTGRSVSRIVKARVRQLAKMRGRTAEEADELVSLFSGHSMRAGYATSAAARDMPGYRIQQHTRHKSAEMVAIYVREADKWTKSGLRGVGF